MDEAIVRRAREAMGPESLLMVDAGAKQRRFLAAGLQMGPCGRRTCWRHGSVTWFEEPLAPDALDDYVALRRAAKYESQAARC